MRKSVVLAAIATAALVILGVAQGAARHAATVVTCGTTITVSTTLSNSLSGCTAGGLVIGASNVTLDCNNHTISGNDLFAGIKTAPGKNNVTIKNCHVTHFSNGIVLDHSNNSTIRDSSSFASGILGGTAGIFLDSSNSSVVKRNIASNGGTIRGFFLNASSIGTFTDNIAVGNGFRGFDVEFSSNGNTFDGNTALGNGSAGFVIAQAAGTKVSNNRALSNQSEGFIAFGSASGTAFTSNAATGNGTVSGGSDCTDFGASTWTSNVGNTVTGTAVCTP